MKPTALVTGANRGIGLQVAKQLSEMGFLVWVGARDAEQGQAAAEQVRGTWLPLDVADAASVLEAADWARNTDSSLAVLVNNAGVLLDEAGDVRTLDEAAVLATLQVNLLGAWRVTSAFLPLMGRGSRIINISSGAGQLSRMGTWAPAYSISKAALNALTLQWAVALAPEGIAVNAVCPGWVRTRMGGSGAPRSLEEGADTALWLAREAPPDLTGKFLRNRREIAW